MKMEASREKLAEMRGELHEATIRFRAAVREWQETCHIALEQLAAAHGATVAS